MPTPVAPMPKAIYLCDDILEDPDTGKLHVLGVFNSIRLGAGADFPYNLDQLCVVVQFTDGLGEVRVHAEVVESATNAVAFASPPRVLRFPTRQHTVYTCLRLTQCRFPRPGIYVVELYCQDTFVDDRELKLLTP